MSICRNLGSIIARIKLNDIKTGKKTLAVRFGNTFSIIEYIILVIFPFIIIIYLYLLWNKLSIWIPYFTLPISIFLILDLSYKQKKDLNEVLYKTSRLLILYSILLSLGISFS